MYVYIYIYIYIYIHISIFLRRDTMVFCFFRRCLYYIVTLIDKTDPSNPLQRESYWRSILKIMAPWGLNVEDCV